MSYSSFYKSDGEDTWHKVTSEHPITYTQEMQPAKLDPGKCPVLYNIKVEVYDSFDVYCNYSPVRAGYAYSYPGPFDNARAFPFGGNNCGQQCYLYLVDAVNPDGSLRYTLGMSSASGTVRYCGSENYKFFFERIDGLPDNCGNGSPGGCATKFIANGQVIATVTKPQCVNVSPTDPSDCECCSSLLTTANRVLSRLNR